MVCCYCILYDRMMNCTRWEEAADSIRFHATVASEGKIASEFRFTTSSPTETPITIGFHAGESREHFNHILSQCEKPAEGCSHLIQHLAQIAQDITTITPLLRKAGKSIAIVIITSSSPNDLALVNALKPFHQLPVSIILRLCTNDSKVLTFWNSQDDHLEVNMDVLDDLKGEADEVYAVNPWITYADPLHRMREFGVNMKELDLLDERLIPIDGFKRVCKIL